MDEKNPYHIFGLAWGLSSFAGLAALLRSGQPLSKRLIASAILNSGLFGLAVAMIWRELYGETRYPWFMLGVSLLAGLGGNSLLDFAIQAIQSGLKIYADRVGQAAPMPTVPMVPQIPPPVDTPTPPPGPPAPPTQ